MEIKAALRVLLGRKALSDSQPLVVREFTGDFNETRKELHKQCKSAINNLWGTESSSSSDGTSYGRFELNVQNNFCLFNALFKEDWLNQIIYHYITVSYADTNWGEFYTWSGNVFDLVAEVEIYLNVMNEAPIMVEIPVK